MGRMRAVAGHERLSGKDERQRGCSPEPPNRLLSIPKILLYFEWTSGDEDPVSPPERSSRLQDANAASSPQGFHAGRPSGTRRRIVHAARGCAPPWAAVSPGAAASAPGARARPPGPSRRARSRSSRRRPRRGHRSPGERRENPSRAGPACSSPHPVSRRPFFRIIAAKGYPDVKSAHGRGAPAHAVQGVPPSIGKPAHRQGARRRPLLRSFAGPASRGGARTASNTGTVAFM